MHLREILSLAFSLILLVLGCSTSSASSSTHHHRHRNAHHVSLSSKHFDRMRPNNVRLHRRHNQPSSDFGVASVRSQLAAKAQEIVASCGSTVISGRRPGARVAGSGRVSLHASGKAVDIKGNPRCIYSHLQGWPGGYSVDYGAVRHVHVSLGGIEDGLRFVHNGSHHRHYRYT
jgi:hypothetical protein